jgi:hypothetical protein
MRWAGVYDEEVQRGLYFEHPSAAVEEWYAKLLFMTRARRPYVWGWGNLGDSPRESAPPRYVAFGLTKSGRRIAKHLFAQRSECQTIDENAQTD